MAKSQHQPTRVTSDALKQLIALDLPPGKLKAVIAIIERMVEADAAARPKRALATVVTTALATRQDEIDEAFKEFWAACPKRAKGCSNPKRPAWLKFRGLVLRDKISPATLILGARKWAASREGEDSRYTPMVATWLNQARWNDETGEITPPQRNGGGGIFDVLEHLSRGD